MVAGMDVGEPCGQDAATGHTEQETGRGHVKTVDARTHRAKHAHREHDRAELSVGHFTDHTRSPCGFAAFTQRGHLGEHFRIGDDDGHGESDECIEQPAPNDGGQHDVPCLLGGEGKFLGRLRYRIEADEEEG